MRNSLLALVFFTLGLVPQLKAQPGPTKLELYAGYDYVRFNVNANVSGQPPSQSLNANGGSGQLIFDLNNWLGLLGNAAGYWATTSTTGGAAIPYLFGPRFNLRRGKLTPFAQTLFGGVVTSGGIKNGGWQNNFAMTAGGGIDIRISEHVSIRPLQAEYFMTKIPDGLNNRQNNFRFSTGVSLLFGRK